MSTKQCSQCYQWKPFAAFYPDQHKQDGYRSECKECTSRAVKRQKTRRHAGSELADAYREYYARMRGQGYRRVGNRWVSEQSSG